MVSVSASHVVGRWFAPQPGHTKDHHKNGTNMCWGGSLTVQPDCLEGSMWNRLWGQARKSSPRINRKSRVLYPGPGLLSSTTRPSMPKKHYNGLIKLIKSMK